MRSAIARSSACGSCSAPARLAALAGSQPKPVTVQPDWPFNIIYSSGTTGTPKGIVQPHGMRWQHVARAENYGYGPDSVTLVATSLCSNTTLVSVFPCLAKGGTVSLFLDGAKDGEGRVAATVPLVFSAAFLMFPPERQTLATVIGGGFAMMAPTVGPYIGGWITETLYKLLPATCDTHVIPTLGQHEPHTREQNRQMFGSIPHEKEWSEAMLTDEFIAERRRHLDPAHARRRRACAGPAKGEAVPPQHTSHPPTHRNHPRNGCATLMRRIADRVTPIASPRFSAGTIRLTWSWGTTAARTWRTTAERRGRTWWATSKACPRAPGSRASSRRTSTRRPST